MEKEKEKEKEKGDPRPIPKCMSGKEQSLNSCHGFIEFLVIHFHSFVFKFYTVICLLQ